MRFRVRVTEIIREEKVYEIEADNAEQATERAIAAAIDDGDKMEFVEVQERYAEVER